MPINTPHLTLFLLFVLNLPAAIAATPFNDALQNSQTDLEHGHVHWAIDRLEALQGQASTAEQTARWAGLLGQAHYQTHQPAHRQRALALLAQAAKAQALPDTERARYANLLANAYKEGEEGAEQAAVWYARALQWAQGDAALMLTVRLNQIRLLPEAQRLAALAAMPPAIAALPANTAQARLLLATGKLAQKHGKPALALAYSVLTQALSAAQKQADKPLQAEALLALAQLYVSQQRTDEALRLTEDALATAQDRQDAPILWQVEAQLAQLLRQQGHADAALAAYRRAVRHIQAVRLDLPVRYDAEGRSSFRDTLYPVYLGLADMLLKHGSENTRNAQELLQEARVTLELSKQAELEDFLGDHCVVHRDLGSLAQARGSGTAVLYPVVLPDRLEMLVDINGTLQRFTTHVSAAELKTTTLALLKALHSTRRLPYEATAQQLYTWLIAPLQPLLQAQHIHTLLAVPDDFLRMLPLAALYDGKQFLIEHYALAVSPAVSVLAGQSPHSGPPKLLLAGLSKARSGYEALPGVEREVRGLQEQFAGDMLLDEGFKMADFRHALAQGEHTIVHIATHAAFEGNAQDTFIKAYDGDMYLDRLQALLQSPERADTELELLTFSACQTAAGNDRAPLGFAGMALRANARSVIGTLWQVNDIAAQKIMTAFYHHKIMERLGKAEALRLAQQEWLREPAFRHPFYWSAFILVGDWL